MNDLTKIQQKVIVTLYKNYLNRKTSMSSDQARCFPNVAYIQENYFKDIDIGELFSICCALHNSEYITCAYYDNTAYSITLTDKTICYMEQRFCNGAKALLKFLVDLK